VTVSVNDPVTKEFTLVIAERTFPAGSGEQPIAASGARVWTLAAVAAALIFGGVMLMIAAARRSRMPGLRTMR